MMIWRILKFTVRERMFMLPKGEPKCLISQLHTERQPWVLLKIGRFGNHLDTLKKQYRGRNEVKMWQKEQLAREECSVRTLLGRERHFRKVESLIAGQKGHIERAAINTPVQGSAADVAMCAMLEINANRRLKELGWRLLLQVHDEVILEGPTESAEEASL